MTSVEGEEGRPVLPVQPRLCTPARRTPLGEDHTTPARRPRHWRDTWGRAGAPGAHRPASLGSSAQGRGGRREGEEEEDGGREGLAWKSGRPVFPQLGGSRPCCGPLGTCPPSARLAWGALLPSVELWMGPCWPHSGPRVASPGLALSEPPQGAPPAQALGAAGRGGPPPPSPQSPWLALPSI